MRIALLSGFVLAAVVRSGAETAAAAPSGAKPVRILFVGNSYTDVNNLPGHVQAFLESKGRPAEVGRYTVGGASLRDHWHHNEGTPAPKPAVPPAPARKGGLDRLLKEQGPWDFVVLQGQSQEALAGQPCEFDAYAAKLVAKIREAQPGAMPVFYMTWARQHIPAQQAEITKTYAEAARAHKALLVPAGEAWKEALGAREGLVLHQPDRSHPTPRGTYLAACVFYAVLAGESPVGLPAKAESNQAGGKPVCDIPEDEARFLQDAAWKTAQRFKDGG
jgi:hypothetical protein